MDNRGRTRFARRRRSALRTAVGMACLLPAAFLLSGCEEPKTHQDVANQSLVEIGEISLEQAEALERDGRVREANVAYRRALWAFRYHEKLTREEPLLLDDALSGIRRTSGR